MNDDFISSSMAIGIRCPMGEEGGPAGGAGGGGEEAPSTGSIWRRRTYHDRASHAVAAICLTGVERTDVTDRLLACLAHLRLSAASLCPPGAGGRPGRERERGTEAVGEAWGRACVGADTVTIRR